jgi:transposase-like protein
MGHSKEFKYKVLFTYENGDYSVRELCKKFGISKISFKKWMNQFQKEGHEGLRPSRVWKSYSKELKVKAVRAYLSGQYSQTELISMYDISSTMSSFFELYHHSTVYNIFHIRIIIKKY